MQDANGKGEQWQAVSLRLPPGILGALAKMEAQERAVNGSDRSECMRRALSAGLKALGYPIGEAE